MSSASPPRPPRYIKTRIEQGVLIVTITKPRLQGDSLANTLRQELIAAVEEAQLDIPRIILDMKVVVSLTSSAFRPILHLHRTVGEKKGQVALCNLSAVVAQALRTTRLIDTGRSSTGAFLVEPDVAAALTRLLSTEPNP